MDERERRIIYLEERVRELEALVTCTYRGEFMEGMRKCSCLVCAHRVAEFDKMTLAYGLTP